MTLCRCCSIIGNMFIIEYMSKFIFIHTATCIRNTYLYVVRLFFSFYCHLTSNWCKLTSIISKSVYHEERQYSISFYNSRRWLNTQTYTF